MRIDQILYDLDGQVDLAICGRNGISFGLLGWMLCDGWDKEELGCVFHRFSALEGWLLGAMF